MFTLNVPSDDRLNVKMSPKCYIILRLTGEHDTGMLTPQSAHNEIHTSVHQLLFRVKGWK